MNEQPNLKTSAATPVSPAGTPPVVVERQPLFPIARTWKVASIVAAVMVLLALLGVGLTTTNSAVAPTYWISLVPVYGLLCVSIAWARSHHDPSLRRPVVVRQIFHWLGIGVALGLDFYVRRTGEETGAAAGINALLLLALGCYLAGIHLEWMFIIVGLLLTLALLIITKADQYLWLIFVVGGLAVAAMLTLAWHLNKSRYPHPRAEGAIPSVPAGS
jgi:hypothetical protein